MNQIQLLGEKLCQLGPSHVIVTGIQFLNNDGVRSMGNLYISSDKHELVSLPYVGGSYSGTGDLFASCLVAGIARGIDIPSIIKMAGTFLEYALTDSVEKQVPENDGVNYEKYLYLLIEHMRNSNSNK
jgi:pyridoxine kinase